MSLVAAAPAAHAAPEVEHSRRFGGLARLYGEDALERLQAAHACVVGIGGVGSWTAEALARSGVGRLTLIDLDHVAESNINRQIHALDSTLGQPKVDAMASRIAAFSPGCRVEVVEDFLDADNAAGLLQGFDVVVDAVDQVRAKVAMALCCRARAMALVMAGGAGGKIDPARIGVDDLARTVQDPLLSKVRARLRREHGFSRDPRRRFGIEAVFSTEAPRRPERSCANAAPQGLACAGYGSSVMMTASIGLLCAARAVEAVLDAGAATRARGERRCA